MRRIAPHSLDRRHVRYGFRPAWPGAQAPVHPNACGFTLIELLLVVALIGILSTIAIPRLMEAVDRANVAHAIGDVRALSTEILSHSDDGDFPASLADLGRAGMLDPWGNPYVYVRLAGGGNGNGGGGGNGQARKDRFLVPLNTDFDLYSKGKDGKSVGPLTAQASRDDIVRALDGGWIGLAEQF